ncbi:cohesin domain-containing protein [Paenibacillus sp.]|uniref:cohesin domain-containing protein n=1 Tax=Paenibacillus sp. TaxID=58172 RepID=UPI00356813FF
MRKGKRIFMVWVLLLLLSMNWMDVLQNAHAEESFQANLTGKDKIQAGESLDLTFGMIGVTENVYAQDLSLTFDPEQFDFIRADSLKEGFSVVGQSESQGRVRIIMASEGAGHAVHEDGELLILRLRAKALVSTVTGEVTTTDIAISNGEGVEMRVGSASHSVQISVVDKAGLLALIASAQTKHDIAVEGTGVGQYPAGSKAPLQAAIDRAQAVADNQAATDEQVQQASNELNAALQTFIASVHTPFPGDLNGDSKYTIGDLAIVSAAYGRTSADPDWTRYVKMDLNYDGKVDIDDLSMIAREILKGVPNPPRAPEWSADKQLSVSDVTLTGLMLTWSGASDPAGVTGYKIYQDGDELAAVTGSVYQVTGLTPNKQYTFKVEAGNASGLWSTDGPSASVTTQPIALPSVVLSGPAVVASGQSFDLTYGLSRVSQSVYAQDLTFMFNPEQLDFIDAESLKEGILVVIQSDTPGRVRISTVSQGADHAIHEDGELLVVHLRSKPLSEPASATVTMTDIVVSNGEGVEMKLNDTSYHVQITLVNKAGLLALIANAQTQHDAAIEGTKSGQYPAGAKAALQAVIDRAAAVADNPAADDQQVQEAAGDLEAALQTFIASVIKSEPGDLNGDSKYSVGDLAIVAAAYGRTPADPDWSKVAKADVNLDGKVDVKDLAWIARLILD